MITFLQRILFFPCGRASRSEYWLSMLGTFVALGIAAALIGLIAYGVIGLLLAIAVFWYSVVVRRMHDLNLTAWNLVWFIPLSIVPVVGLGAGVILGIKEGNDDDNFYGHSARYR